MGQSQPRDSSAKKGAAAQFSAQELLASANQLIDRSRSIIKEVNEAQYSTYCAFQADKRIAQSSSIEQDILHFLGSLELTFKRANSIAQQEQSPSSLTTTTSSASLSILLAQASTLLRFTELAAHASMYESTDIIMKSQQLIEYIEIIMKREKSTIKKLGFKKVLDQAQIDLNQSSNALETFAFQKLAFSPNIRFESILPRIKAIHSHLSYITSSNEPSIFSSASEIPYEIE